MRLKKNRLPWQKEHKRYNIDPFYKSQTWRNIRSAFINSESIVNGKPVSNAICRLCHAQGIIKPVHTVDHIKRIKDGGNRSDFNNLQSLCESCHAKKSAQEGNNSSKIGNLF